MLKVGLIGTGGIALANHVPGISRCRDAAVTALCDANPSVLDEAARSTGITRTFADGMALIREADVDAVIVATPNRAHHPLAMAAIAAGKHVLCEKPLALTLAQAREMAAAADRAQVRHMTAFTYRFVPAMRYMAHLVRTGFVGQPWHFRAQRFQDWQRRALGWRQRAEDAGTGELGDMLSHRIDYGHLLVGAITDVMARTRQVWPTRVDTAGREQPSDLEDWVACLATFASGATGVLESSKIATGHGEGGHSRDYCEVNGPDGSLIYELKEPHQVLASEGSSRFEPMRVPREFLTLDGSEPPAGVDPLLAFRWEQSQEFVDAIRNGRACVPSFHDGVRAQAVMDAIVRSAAEQRTISVPVS
jgi:predicted dehydrogenase